MKNKKAFTIIELMVWVFILTLIISIWFFSYSGYSKTARNSVREVSINNISVVLNNIKAEAWGVLGAFPEKYAKLTSSWKAFSYQWNFPKDSFGSFIQAESAIDPLLKTPYYYSLSWDYSEFWFVYMIEWNSKWLTEYKYKWWKNPVFLSNWNYIFSDVDFDSISSSNYKMYSDSWELVWDDILLAKRSKSWLLSSCYDYLDKDSSLSWNDWEYLLSLSSWIFKAKCDMTTSSWWWTRVFYSDSDLFEYNIKNSSFDNITNEAVKWNNNYSILYDMLWKKSNRDYNFLIKDDNLTLQFSQNLSYLDNPNVWNGYKFISWNKTFYPSESWAWPYFWLFLWDFWWADMQNNCILTTSSNWWTSPSHYNCLRDKIAWNWPWPFNNSASSTFIEIWQK